MQLAKVRNWIGCLVLMGSFLGGGAAAAQAQCPGDLTLDRLQRMSLCQLAELFTQAEVGSPPCGNGRGCLLCSTDERLPRVKVCLSNAFWRGKVIAADGSFVNRWCGGLRAIRSQYVIGPSWVDGRPAVLMEYAPGTAILGNAHDELRQVGPGLYLGPLYDRCPCPKLRGYLALQVETGHKCR
jgi:hypothetical protein